MRTLSERASCARNALFSNESMGRSGYDEHHWRTGHGRPLAKTMKSVSGRSIRSSQPHRRTGIWELSAYRIRNACTGDVGTSCRQSAIHSPCVSPMTNSVTRKPEPTGIRWTIVTSSLRRYPDAMKTTLTSLAPSTGGITYFGASWSHRPSN